MVGKTKTKYLERGTAALMAPEIMIEECILQTAGIEDLKRIDIWVAVMMLFVLLNPDQRYPLQKDIKLLKANTGNVFVPNAEHLLKKFLIDKRLPMSSAKYNMAQQACYYQRLRYIFQQNMKYDPERHCTASPILPMLQFNEEIVYEPPEVLQTTVLEENDLEIAISGETVTSTKIPETDGTNACTYLTLSIIDALSLQQGNDVQEYKSSVTLTIIDFPKLFNRYHTINGVVDVYEAYELLSRNHLLKHNFEFIEISVDNEKVFSNEVQTKLSKELSSLVATAVKNEI